MMDLIWSFLTSAENREFLSWLGGGISTFVLAVWTVFKFIADRPSADTTPAPEPQDASREIFADRAGAAAGGDINSHSGNTITMKSGLSGWQVAAIIAILGGLGLLAISQVGSRVVADNGSAAVGGDVSDSTIIVGD